MMSNFQKQQSEKILSSYMEKGGPGSGRKKNPYNSLFSTISENSVGNQRFVEEEKRLFNQLTDSYSPKNTGVQEIEDSNFDTTVDERQRQEADNILENSTLNTLLKLQTLYQDRVKEQKQRLGYIQSHLQGGIEHQGQVNLLERFQDIHTQIFRDLPGVYEKLEEINRRISRHK